MPEDENVRRIDFPKQRRAEGRLLGRAVRKLVAAMQQLGINCEQARDATSAQHQLLAERLQDSVVPLFIRNRSEQPDRIGSCVLVRLDSEVYAFTAAHVIRAVGSATLLAPSEAKGGKL